MAIDFQKLDQLKEEARGAHAALLDITERWRESKLDAGQVQRAIQSKQGGYGSKYGGSKQEKEDTAKLQSLEAIEITLRQKRDHAEAVWKSLGQLVSRCEEYAGTHEPKEFGVRQGLREFMAASQGGR